MKFKIGDKVKFTKPQHPHMLNRIGIIRDIYLTSIFPLRVDVSGYCLYPTLENEIELYIKVGKQLEFAFMETK